MKRAMKESSEIEEKREEDGTKLETTELEAPEDYVFTKDDILGPDPTVVILESPGWMKLQKLTGLEDVKHSIRNLLETVKSNYQRELEEKPLHKLSLNRLFPGPSGDWKDTRGEAVWSNSSGDWSIEQRGGHCSNSKRHYRPIYRSLRK